MTSCSLIIQLESLISMSLKALRVWVKRYTVHADAIAYSDSVRPNLSHLYQGPGHLMRNDCCAEWPRSEIVEANRGKEEATTDHYQITLRPRAVLLWC